MKPTKPHPLLQSSALVVLGAIAAVVVTLVCYRLQAGALPPAMLYVFIVVMVSLRGNLVASIWVSLLAVASLDYFFTSPQWAAFPIRQLRDVLVLIGLLSTALVINRLIVRVRQSFKEVEAAREQLRMVIDTVPVLLVSTRPDGAVEFVNQQWRDFLGFSWEEFQRGWAGALHPDDQNRFLAEWRAALESGVPLESEARMRRADGQYRWLLIRVVPSRNRQGHIVRWYGTSADIEDRKRAEEQARQADRERRVIIDTIPALLWSTLPDGSSDFNNQRWLEYSGLSADQAAGWGYIDVLHPEDYERRTPLWRAAFAAGESMEDEARLRRADGQYRWFLHRAVPLRDEGGKILKWLGTSTDIEDLKRAEGVLREQAGLLDLSHDTVFVRDMSDVITYWNRGAEALYGWSRDEAIGHTSHRLTQTIFPAPLEQINEELLRTGRWEGELVHTKRDGSRVVVASRWSIQRDELGRPAAILETNNDVTQRNRAEEELRRSEAYLAEAQRLSHTGSWAWNLQRPEESYWSPEAYRIFGLNPDRGAAPSLEEFRACIHPDDLSRVEEARTQAIRDKTNFEVDYRAILPDGSKRYLHAVGRPIVSPAGEVVELVGTVIDTTERKRAERALRRARERALGARFAAVLDERARLARDIHDTLLQGFTGIALKLVAASSRVTHPPDSIAALQDLVRLAQETLTDARRAVWDLRSPALVAADFPTALRSAAEDCVRGTQLELEHDVGDPPRPLDPEIEAVVLRVAQEALTNVVKHADAHRVRVELSFETHRVCLSVSDDGRGFVVPSDFQVYGGHWGVLGMRERASQVHGKLSLRSSPGQGTELRLLVPYSMGHRSPALSGSSSLGL